MANRNFLSQKMFTGHAMPVLLDCNFVVDSTNGNGLGIRNLKGPYVQAVYMHTSATAAASNPNPTAGTIVLQLQDNYNRVYTGGHSIVSPISGSALTATTIHVPVLITSLGTATVAQWQAVGVPKGLTPAVGLAFVPTASGTIGGSATVEIAAAAGSSVASIETLGDANASIAPNPQAAQGYGAQIILQCRDYAGALVAPADGSVISLSLLLSNSSVILQGE